MSRDAVLSRDLAAFGRAMVANTEAQGFLCPALVGAAASRVMELAGAEGAVGWKVNGAGGNGGSVTVLSADPRGKASFERRLAAADGRWRLLPLRPSRTRLQVRDADEIRRMGPDCHRRRPGAQGSGRFPPALEQETAAAPVSRTQGDRRNGHADALPGAFEGQDDLREVLERRPAGRSPVVAPLAEGTRAPCRAITLDVGHLGERVSVGQLALWDEAELIGRNVVACVNLGTRQMGPYLSQALVLGAPHRRARRPGPGHAAVRRRFGPSRGLHLLEFLAGESVFRPAGARLCHRGFDGPGPDEMVVRFSSTGWRASGRWCWGW